MSRVLAAELPSRVDERVVVAGWLHHQRLLSRVGFLLIRDRTGITQVVVEDESIRAELEALDLTAESIVEVEGAVVASAQAPAGVEIHDPKVRLVERAVAPPLELRRKVLKEQLPTILDHAAVALRHPRLRGFHQIAAASIGGFRRTLDELGFTEVNTPKIVGGATEGGANVFQLDYFGRPAFLAQSPQFYKQTMVGVFERVYETGPVFRAEPHDTARHLAEYISLDAELGFIRDHRDVMAVLRSTLAGMIETVDARCGDLCSDLGVRLPSVPIEIPAIHFTEAQELVERESGERIVGEPDLSPSAERWLGTWAQREHGSDFVFVVGYPMVKRPFYTHPDPTRPVYSNSFDLLFRGLELVTGGQRLHRYADYERALDGQDLADFETYLEAFRHGMPPHGGFAIGLERWVARLAEVANVREVTLFPRDLNRLRP